MNRRVMIQLVRQWRSLDAQAASIEYRRCEIAAKMRSQFPDGELGERSFMSWCVVELSFNAQQAAAMKLRAVTGGLIRSPDQLQGLGGWSAVSHLSSKSTREATRIIETALSSDKSVRTVMRERRVSVPSRVPSVYSDACAMAKYLSSQDLPAELRRIVEKYLPAKRAAA